MPTLILTRAGGWTDRFRSYSVFVDDEQRGTIGAKQTKSFDVAEGTRRVQLRIGLLYSSPVVTVSVASDGVALECGSNTIPGLAVLSLARPGAWIYLRPKGQRRPA